MSEFKSYYSDNEILIEDKNILDDIHYLTAHGIDFYLIINRDENRAIRLTTDLNVAEESCKLDRRLIYNYIHNNK